MSVLQTYPNVDKEADCCVVCRDGFTGQEDGVGHSQTVSRVDHIFHEECLKPWWKAHGACPTCREELTDSENRFGGRDVQAVPTAQSVVIDGVVLVGAPDHVQRNFRRAPEVGPIQQKAMATRIRHKMQTQRIEIDRSPDRMNFFQGMNIANLRDQSIVNHLREQGLTDMPPEAFQDFYDMYEALKDNAEDDPHFLEEGLFQTNYDFLCSIFEPPLAISTLGRVCQ